MISPWKRRQQNAKKRHHDRWKIGMQEFKREAGGLMHTMLIDRSSIRDMIAAADAGDQHACMLVMAVGRTLAAMERAPVGTGPMCLFCDTTFTAQLQPAGLVLFLPGANPERYPENIVSSPVCAQCLSQRTEEKLLREASAKMSPDGEFILKTAVKM